MSTTVDSKDMKKAKEVKSGWDNDDEDDNWDDWGDAEDHTATANETKSQVNITKPTTPTRTIKTIAKEQTENNIASKDFKCNKQTSGQTQENKTWGSVWKPWGGVVSSVFSTASEGLGNITSTVSQGLTNVMGVPEPEELARLNKVEEQKEVQQLKKEHSKDSGDGFEQEQQSATPAFGLNLVSGVTTLGSKVLNTGLDTLEGIGKKTMNILQENDPLLMNKRKMLGLESEKPNLSEILKEAKQESDQLENTLKELKLEKSKELLRFDILFENNCGLVHLEALEILSKESELKLQSLLSAVSGIALAELQETVNEVKELMDLEDLESEGDGFYDEDELNQNLLTAIEDMDLQITFDDLQKNWAVSLDWIKTSAEEADVQQIFAKGITALAETCALEISKLHKIAELLLVKEHHSTANEVDSIVQLCRQFTHHLNGLANRFAAPLSAKKSDDAKEQINTLFAETCHALKEIDKAFKLFLPILQIGAV